MIDIRKLKELVRLMVENDLTELDLQDQAETVSIKRGPDAVPVVQTAPAAAAPAAVSHSPAEPAASNDASAEAAGGAAVESPMVGTFYSAPDPESSPFVKAGDSVSEGDVVCIVEAMKVFNEIKAEVSGTVSKVLVKNGEAVEFGQKLFLLKPE
ncbi:MAG: acetyl-CoA carboxylase biotin carboxyl carrier protein [Planctomycetota bacterium]